jgi:hypothetical protein
MEPPFSECLALLKNRVTLQLLIYLTIFLLYFKTHTFIHFYFYYDEIIILNSVISFASRDFQ